MQTFLLRSFVVLAMVCSAGTEAGTPECSQPDELLGAVQELASGLSTLLQTALGGPFDSGQLARETRALEQRLDRLAEAQEGVTDASQRALVQGKIEQLRGLVHNLRLLARDPDAARGMPGGPVVNAGAPRPVGDSATLSPGNDGCSNPAEVSLETITGDTSTASNDGQASCGASLTSPDVWFRFTAPFAGTFFAVTVGSAFDTVLSTHSGCPGTVANEIDCNDDSYGLWSSIRLEAAAGEQVLIRLAGAGGATGAYQLTVGTDGWIDGRITAAADGAPIEGVRAKVFNDHGAWIASDASDANGDYLVTGLEEAEHFVGTAYGTTPYLHELWDDIPCRQGAPYSCDPTTGDPVVPPLGGAVTADFALERESVITGTVTAAVDGVLIVDCWVELFDESGDKLGSDSTEADGTYRFGRLAAGTYRLLAAHDHFAAEVWDDHPCPGGLATACDPLTGDPVAAPVGTTVDGIDFALADMGSIAGVVTEAGGGLPVGGVSVEAVDQSWSGYGAITEPDGSYRIRGLGTGVYRVFTLTPLHFDELYDGLPCEPDCDPAAGTPVAVTQGVTTAGVDFDLVRLGGIAGTVTEAGSGLPLADVWLAAFDSAGSYLGSALTSPSGTYQLVGLAAGVHYLTATSDDHASVLYDGIPCPWGCDPTAGTPVQVQLAATTPGVDFVLEPHGGIAGTVREQAAGTPMSSVGVEVWRDGTGSVRTAWTGPDGHYEVDQLPAGSYFVVSDKGLPVVDQLYAGFPCWDGPPAGCDPTKGTPVLVTPGALTLGIDLAVLDLRLVIFVDSFESGATGAWSSTAP